MINKILDDKNKKKLFIGFLIVLFFGFIFLFSFIRFDLLNYDQLFFSFHKENYYSDKDLEEINNQKFREAAVSFLSQSTINYFKGGDSSYPEILNIEGYWTPMVTIYYKGVEAKGIAKDQILAKALEKALYNSIKNIGSDILKEENADQVKFLIEIPYSNDKTFSFIGKGESASSAITEGVVAIKELKKRLIREKIEQGKEVLLKLEHPDYHGFYKYWLVSEDNKTEPRLHTVYSASIIYTLLHVYDFEKSTENSDATVAKSSPRAWALRPSRTEEILEKVNDWGGFLLTMQNKNKSSDYYGAFSYSLFFLENPKKEINKIEFSAIDDGKREVDDFYIDKKGKQLRYVSGTSALNIFTMLRLYDLTNKEKYLESAKLAGDWLTDIQKENGVIIPYFEYKDRGWVHGNRESLLYEGQVLSALSRLYRETDQERYYNTAQKIANRFVSKYEQNDGQYITGDYRDENPISNSWVVYSLMDFYRASNTKEKKSKYIEIIFNLSSEILKHQRDDKNDLSDYGRWDRAYSTSGNGWISEVMTDSYRFCLSQGRNDCQKYKKAVIKVIRWLVQNTISEENSFWFDESEEMIGGILWSPYSKYIRTDSICHGLNGYIRMFPYLEKEVLISIPEKDIKEIFDIETK